ATRIESAALARERRFLHFGLFESRALRSPRCIRPTRSPRKGGGKGTGAMRAQLSTADIVLYENSVPTEGIEHLRERREKHTDALAKNDSPAKRPRYEHAIKNIEQAIREWKAHNPDKPDPFDDDAWGEHIKKRAEEYKAYSFARGQGRQPEA